MRGFDLEQLLTFATVAEAGSLSNAAPMRRLSQSSVSEQIRKLEERAGVPLFVRSKKGVAPTPAGMRLLDHARRIVALNEAAFEDLRGHAIEGELRVAITDYFRTHEIAGMLVQLRKCYPQLSMHVSSMQGSKIEQAYRRGAIDIGLTMNLVDAGAKNTVEPGAIVLRREALVWVAAPSIGPVPARPLPLVLLPDNCWLHQVAIHALEEHEIPYRMAHTASGVVGLQLVLAAGYGVSCLNTSAIGEGLVQLGPRAGLPPLPKAVFSLLPPRRGEAGFVTRAREVLATRLAA